MAEEIAIHMGYIGVEQLRGIAEPLHKSASGQYLMGLLKE